MEAVNDGGRMLQLDSSGDEDVEEEGSRDSLSRRRGRVVTDAESKTKSRKKVTWFDEVQNPEEQKDTIIF